ncbi:3-deoxy-manno-octulosonate cytidylyltransferase [Methylonatrum kenyense]|uniref:3-deoxy-manno-octulosonate cytidylyltransferase n=1 Tax=Methylonatrum kenyense TaxID=455253 RepID=UPI0020BDAF38|nr:3-deoxy-manno-octulosonate cytidylyltransferase [Methylonatrum kenyense]MCK8516484.1 3-deoxy-manno-octulosonate cytidylyltransferase [Methylonatrum kenyense]
MTEFLTVIPARYQSSRFPGKPLAVLAGKPMVQHVWEKARASGASRVLVATDDDRIRAACESFGADVMRTAAHHRSGTDRLAEVVERLALPDSTIVVNLQGDEPLMPPGHIRRVADLLVEHNDAEMSTLLLPMQGPVTNSSANTVKAVTDRRGYALYFSRAPIPWPRELAGTDKPATPSWHRHLGIYGYRAGFLRRYPDLAVSELERLESLEQLRALDHGIRIITGTVAQDGGPGIDTPEDLHRAQVLLTTADT